MIRRIVEKTQAFGDRCCEIPDKYKQLATSTNNEDRKLFTRLQGTAYCYMIIWTLFQLGVFVALLLIFYWSPANPFMTTTDCCEANEVLTRMNNELPLKHCSNFACPFITGDSAAHPSTYDRIFSGRRSLNDQRPRYPKNGDFSIIFPHHQEWWCCNLDARSDTCCNKMPYGIHCGLVMWLAGFSAVCAVLMSQVMLQGFYSFCSRKSAWFTLLSVIPGIFLRLLFFFMMFYFFFTFMFTFIFFFIPMTECDNPYAFQWWKFGYLYVYFFFQNFAYMLGNGFKTPTDDLTFSQLIASHTTLSTVIDVVFSLIYMWLARRKDNKGQPYFYLTFFKL